MRALVCDSICFFRPNMARDNAAALLKRMVNNVNLLVVSALSREGQAEVQ